MSFAELEGGLASQKARTARIPVPNDSRFDKFPPSIKRQTDKIVWMTVNMGYQPKMTQAWFSALGEFQQEARFNRVFSSSVFWIVTRTNDCFY